MLNGVAGNQLTVNHWSTKHKDRKKERKSPPERAPHVESGA